MSEDFDAIYILDLGGNVRKNPKLSGTTHNVFGIQLGVSINFLVKKCSKSGSHNALFYSCVEGTWRKEEKYRFLDEKEQYCNIEWKPIEPDRRNTWLIEGQHTEFESFIPIGSRETKAAKDEVADVIFKTYSLGVNTARDAWARTTSIAVRFTENMEQTINTYNGQVQMWERQAKRGDSVDDFVISDDTKISWSEALKVNLRRGRLAEYSEKPRCEIRYTGRLPNRNFTLIG